MFVNNTPLFITMSRSINFMTVKHMPKNMAKKLGKSLKWVVKIYSINSMILQTVLINVHFYNTIDYLTEISLLTTIPLRDMLIRLNEPSEQPKKEPSASY